MKYARYRLERDLWDGNVACGRELSWCDKIWNCRFLQLGAFIKLGGLVRFYRFSFTPSLFPALRLRGSGGH